MISGTIFRGGHSGPSVLASCSLPCTGRGRPEAGGKYQLAGALSGASGVQRGWSAPHTTGRHKKMQIAMGQRKKWREIVIVVKTTHFSVPNYSAQIMGCVPTNENHLKNPHYKEIQNIKSQCFFFKDEFFTFLGICLRFSFLGFGKR